MRFLSYKIWFNDIRDILYLQKCLLGWADIVQNDLVSISKKFASVSNNIYLVILSSQKNGMYHFFSSIFDIHVAVDMAYHIRNKFTI